MAAPEHVPSRLADQPRSGLKLPPARSWRADRPADLGPGQPAGPQLGSPGPDQGFGIKLARRFTDRLVLADGEVADDAVAGCLGVGLKRASVQGRAPVIRDFEVAYRIWGFLGDAPDELVAYRRPLFEGAAHRYRDQREVADRVPVDTLRLGHAEVAERVPAEWRRLLGLA